MCVEGSVNRGEGIWGRRCHLFLCLSGFMDGRQTNNVRWGNWIDGCIQFPQTFLNRILPGCNLKIMNVLEGVYKYDQWWNANQCWMRQIGLACETRTWWRHFFLYATFGHRLAIVWWTVMLSQCWEPWGNYSVCERAADYKLMREVQSANCMYLSTEFVLWSIRDTCLLWNLISLIHFH